MNRLTARKTFLGNISLLVFMAFLMTFVMGIPSIAGAVAPTANVTSQLGTRTTASAENIIKLELTPVTPADFQTTVTLQMNSRNGTLISSKTFTLGSYTSVTNGAGGHVYAYHWAYTNTTQPNLPVTIKVMYGNTLLKSVDLTLEGPIPIPVVTPSGGGGDGGGGILVPAPTVTKITNSLGSETVTNGTTTLTVDPTRVNAALSGAGGVLEFEARGDLNSTSANVVMPTSLVSSIFGAGHPMSLSFGGVTLLLQPNSFTLPEGTGNIQFGIRRADPNSGHTPGNAAYRVGGSMYEITIRAGQGSNGQLIENMSVPATLTLPYNAESLNGAPEEYQGVYRWNGAAWDYLGGTVDAANDTVSVPRDSLSTYAVMAYVKNYDDMNGHWAEEAAKLMAAKHITKNITTDSFGPSVKTTRGEFIAWIMGALQLTERKSSVPFKDVSPTAWYASAIGSAQAYGIISGYADGTCSPDAQINREQMAVIVAKALAVSGSSIKLSDQRSKEIVAGFADKAKISRWALSDVAVIVNAGLVKGRGQNQYAPKDQVTRAEAVVLVKNIYSSQRKK